MKVIVAGSRDIQDVRVVARAIRESGFNVTEVVSGGCRGVDFLAELVAKSAGWPIRRFPADWKAYGRRAGPIRNGQMAAYADALVAVWDGKSRGTKNMIDQAAQRGLAVYVHKVSTSVDPTPD